MKLRLKRNDKIGLFLFVAFAISTTLTWLFEERFNQPQWEIEHTKRYKMADDIIESQLLVGKTKQEVISLLGNASPSTLKGREHLVYDLGKPPSFFERIEERLVVIFDNNLVIKVIHSKE